MVDGRAKLCVASSTSSEEDMYSSCFSTTKYTCLKCKIPICNNCSVFEKDEDSSGWAPLKSVGSLRALCTVVCKRRTEDCITLITAFLFFCLLSFPVFFAENKLLVCFTKIDNFLSELISAEFGLASELNQFSRD